MKIGELAKSTGLSTKTIRFYEAEGLIPDPPRTDSGYRAYVEPDVARLGFILKAKRLGLSLEEIKSILQLHDRSEPTCVHVRNLVSDKLAHVERTIEELQEFRADLIRLREESGDLVDCRPAGGNICGIIEQGTLGKGEPAWQPVKQSMNQSMKQP